MRYHSPEWQSDKDMNTPPIFCLKNGRGLARPIGSKEPTRYWPIDLPEGHSIPDVCTVRYNQDKADAPTYPKLGQ
jgi:hypothetical protein